MRKHKDSITVFDKVLGRIRGLKTLKYDYEVAALLGMSSKALAERKTRDSLPDDKIELFCERESINKHWLLTGEGPMRAGGSPLKEAPDDDFIFIPQVRGEISAGEGLAPDEVVDLKIAFTKDWIKRKGDPKSLSLIRIRGDSMEPTLRSGDLVLVDHNRNYLDPQGGIYAIAMDDLMMVKRVQVLYPTDKVSIISDNPQYESIEIKAGEVRINGKVIWFGRELER